MTISWLPREKYQIESSLLKLWLDISQILEKCKLSIINNNNSNTKFFAVKFELEPDYLYIWQLEKHFH